MAKIFPQESTSSECINSERETYTLWMKSLVLHSNGCTVYDSNGDIVYRVDNYDRKGTREVNLMDLRGKVLCTIKKVLISLSLIYNVFHQAIVGIYFNLILYVYVLIQFLTFSYILQRLLAIGSWEGHRYCSNSSYTSQEQPWFQVKRCNTGKVACQIKVGCQKYCIVRISGKAAAFKIVTKDGHIVAEVIDSSFIF